MCQASLQDVGVGGDTSPGPGGDDSRHGDRPMNRIPGRSDSGNSYGENKPGGRAGRCDFKQGGQRASLASKRTQR